MEEIHLENMENVKIFIWNVNKFMVLRRRIVKIIAKVMILIIHFVLHKKRRETMKDDKKEKKWTKIHGTYPAHQRQGSEYKTGDGSGKCEIMTESFKETAGEPQDTEGDSEKSGQIQVEEIEIGQ